MTVGYRLSALRQPIRERATERNDQPVRLLEESMRPLLRGIDRSYHCVAIRPRKNTVMLPALPQLIEKDQVIYGINSWLNIRKQTRCHGRNVEKYPIGVLQDVELPVLQGVAYVFGKTATRQQDLIAVADRPWQRPERYRQLKFH